MSTAIMNEGYKQTDVGLIPEGWDVYSFDEVFKFLKTGSNSREDLTEDGEVNYIHYGDIHCKYGLILDCSVQDMPFIPKEKVKGISLLEDGDLILVDASEDYEGIKSCTEIKNTNGKKIVSGLHTILLRGNKNILADGFKTYITSIPYVSNEMRKIANGLKVFGVSKGNLKTIKIPLPSFPEQEAIAKVLSDMDKLIDKTEQLIIKKQDIKTGAMQKLLTKGIGHTQFKQTEMGLIPIDWMTKTFKDISKVNQGFQIAISNRHKSSGSNRFVYITIQYLNSLENAEYIENPPKNVICFKDDVLMTRTGNTGVIVTDVEGVFHNNFFKIDFDRKLINKDFLVYYLSSPRMRKLILIRAGLTTIPDLNHNDFYSLPILIPELKEQQVIAEILSDMDSEIEKLEEQLDKYKSIKIGMMQKLLTGKKRLT